MIDLQSAHDFAIELAKEAGEIARKHYNPNIVFNPKEDNTPITEADIEINRLVIKRCSAQYPDVGILGEEESSHRESDWLWVCDPIDGTIPFALGAKSSTFCLALVHDGAPVVGIVYDFMNDRLYSAIKSGGAYLNGKVINAANVEPLRMIELGDYPAGLPVGNARALFFEKGWLVSNYLSNAFMAMTTATGRTAGTVYSGRYAWDMAAPKVIAEELGCRVTDLDGKDQRYDNTNLNGGVILHPAYADEIMGLFTKARASRH